MAKKQKKKGPQNFSRKTKEEALVRSRRCCCVCHEFVGLLTNVHHISQRAHGGAHTIENAIVLCLRCHGEVGHYNDDHPLGNKYTADELIRHRDEWWEWCRQHPNEPLLKSPIYVSPTSFRLGSADLVAYPRVTIYNTTDRCYYQVCFKIALESPTAKSLKLQCDDFHVEFEQSLPIGGLRVSTAIWGLGGKDHTGREALILFLSVLEPRSRAIMTMRYGDAADLTDGKAHKAEVGILAFDTKQNPAHASGEEKVSLPAFKLPEDGFMPQGMVLRMIPASVK